ncbi:Receptor-like serine/threonine-protein kinase [Psidium guajava]|nr:Receptor-like serine/threonine-protein kinase [Psidium guajava]
MALFGRLEEIGFWTHPVPPSRTVLADVQLKMSSWNSENPLPPVAFLFPSFEARKQDEERSSNEHHQIEGRRRVLSLSPALTVRLDPFPLKLEWP